MSPRYIVLAILLAGLVVGMWASTACAQNVAAPATEDDAPTTLRELIDQSLEWYEIFSSPESEEPAKPIVALRWANNARGSEDGTTVLYVAGGRPLAAVCIYPWAGRLEHDFESLSRSKIVARREGQVVWQPQAAGVSFSAVPEAPGPDESRNQRLRQMKALAEQFQATMLGWKTDSTDREELRLLSKPLYRYDPKDGAVFDGAVFAFATGTDPEVLLLLEAVREGEKTGWHYAFARRTSGQLEGRWRDRPVWNAARFPQQNDPKQPHFTKGTPLPPELTVEVQAQAEAKTP
jgi:hypothetical protein